jgi:MIP family channel proteins
MMSPSSHHPCHHQVTMMSPKKNDDDSMMTPKTIENKEGWVAMLDIENDMFHNNIYLIDNAYIREFISETLGMYWFILTSIGNIAILVSYPESNMTWLGVSISWGLNLMIGINIASLNSNAHLNPCLSLSMYLFKRAITFKQLISYTLAQLIGAFCAAATVYGIYYEKFITIKDKKSISSIFVTYENSSISHVTSFFTEFTGTALLVGGIFIILHNKNTKDNASMYVGMLLSSLVLSIGYQSAFAFNPARDLGPRIFMECLGYDTFLYANNYWWIPIVADYCGAIFGSLVYFFLVQQQTYD